WRGRVDVLPLAISSAAVEVHIGGGSEPLHERRSVRGDERLRSARLLLLAEAWYSHTSLELRLLPGKWVLPGQRRPRLRVDPGVDVDAADRLRIHTFHRLIGNAAGGPARVNLDSVAILRLVLVDRLAAQQVIEHVPCDLLTGKERECTSHFLLPDVMLQLP